MQSQSELLYFKSNNYNINVNSHTTIGNSVLLNETINPGSKAA